MFMVCPYPYHAPTGLSNSMSLLAIAAFAALAGAGPVPPRVSRLSGFPFSLYGVGAPANVNHGYAAG